MVVAYPQGRPDPRPSLASSAASRSTIEGADPSISLGGAGTGVLSLPEGSFKVSPSTSTANFGPGGLLVAGGLFRVAAVLHLPDPPGKTRAGACGVGF